MTQITNEQLKFMWEAKKVFEVYPYRETYRNEDETLIALRMGEDRDCVMVYELEGYVANFVQQMKPNPGIRPTVFSFAYEMEKQLKSNDFKGGWSDEHKTFLYQKLDKKLSELRRPLSNGKKVEITEICADIANYAMMIADNEGDTQ